MTWTRIKKIMIYFLLAMNLFMLGFIAVRSYRQSIIPDNVISAATKVLTEAGFDISGADIPDKYYTLSSLDATFYSASDLSDLFFGTQVPFSTLSQSLVARQNDATLTVYSNYFVYENGNKPHSQNAEKLKKALEKFGIDMNGTVFDESTKCFYKMYKGHNLFNMYIDASLDENGNICRLSAQWPKKLKATGKVKMSFVETITKLQSAFPAGGKLKTIETGYSLHLIGGENYKFIPAWRVNTDGELKILE